MKYLSMLLLLSVIYAGSPNHWVIKNSYGCTDGAIGLIGRNTLLDRDCDGTFDTVLVEDTSKAIPVNGVKGFYLYQWHIDTGQAGPDSATFKEVALCSSKTLATWIPMVSMSSKDSTIDSIVTVTYGANGIGAYEADFSRCEALRFITRQTPASEYGDTVVIQKRALKSE